MRALRVIVADVAACYAVLGRVHERYRAVAGEFDDYIARPKANGYQSLHTVVQDDDGRAGRDPDPHAEMHEHAEHGVSAHWAYKEADAAYAGGERRRRRSRRRSPQARMVVLRQLLAWERDLAGRRRRRRPAVGGRARPASTRVFDDRIYVFTPQAAVVELTAGATPIDFAYAVHTDLGHRCRGAKVDGAMVPLNTPLQSGQTVEVTAAKTGGPSLDWLNPELGYLQSARSKAKVRAWFNALAQAATIARGREAVEKLLQREGKTALKLDELATRLGFRSADALFEVVGKDEFSLRSIEALLRPAPAPKRDADEIALRPSRAPARPGGVLVVGVDSLLTSAGALLPAGAARRDRRLRHARQGRRRAPRRLQQPARAGRRARPSASSTSPGARADAARPALYPVDVSVEASDRPGPAARRLRGASPRRRSTSSACTRSRCATAAAAPRS